MRKRILKRLLWSMAIISFVAYVTSYLVVTQIKYKQFREAHCPGFCYVSWEKESDASWERKEGVVATFYFPMNYVENRIFGYGMPHAACTPFFTLSR